MELADRAFRQFREMQAFRCSLDKKKAEVVADLRKLSRALMKDFDSNSRMLTGNYGDYGVLHIQSFQPRLSKSIIDEIDCALFSGRRFTMIKTGWLKCTKNILWIKTTKKSKLLP